MQGRGPEYIPTKSGKRGEKLRKIGYDESTHYMNTASFFIRKRINNKAKTSLKLEPFPIDIIQKMHWREIANTILTDPNLSQSYGNPEYYPPVPEYAQPKGREISEQEVREIQFKIAQSRVNAGKKNTVVSENFGDAWVSVSNTPIDRETFEELHNAALSYIDPYIFFTHYHCEAVKQGRTAQKLYSYPNIVDKVKWYVTFCCNEKGNEILGMYCYRNKKAIEALTGFLADTPTNNEANKNEAILRLSQIYYQI